MPAQYADGRFARASDPRSRQCQHVKDDGSQCRAWALREELFCRFHSLTPEERKQESQDAIAVRRRKSAQRRAIRDALRQGRAVPFDHHADALRRLQAAQDKLEQLHAEGRISAAELPQVLRPVR